MRRAITGALAVVALAAGGGWWWRQHAPSPQAAAAKAPAPAPAEQPIEFAAGDVATVAAVTISRTVPLTGTLKPVEQTVVKTTVPGELREVAAREGTAVRRGQAVARVEALEDEGRVRERDAQLKAAASQGDQAKRTLDNTRQLKERNFVSQSALDQAQSAWE
ncbi:MAG: efflux RND transporter periplasmic adaptor subunit, partial [Burkholderiales bacterium]